MDGSSDFRPEGSGIAPNPSVADMLRRARDAQLGTTLGTATSAPAPNSRAITARLQGGALVALGMLIGVLFVHLFGGAAPASSPTIIQTSATAQPTAQLLTVDDIAQLTQAYYDSHDSTDYIMMGEPTVQIEQFANRQVTACATYTYAATDAPDIAIGTNTRDFTLAAASDGTWQVVQMGYAGSCGLD